MNPAIRIYVVGLSSEGLVPLGGVRMLHRHVTVLQEAGFDAQFVESPNDLPSLNPVDILVLPEIYGRGISQVRPGIRKVIFNQNCYLTFSRGFGLAGAKGSKGPMDSPYQHPDVIAAIVVSKDSENYLRFAYPELKVHRMQYAVDPALFLFSPTKKMQLALMPRKNLSDSLQVVNILNARGVLSGIPIIPIDGLPLVDVALVLRESLFFLHFAGPEGWGLPAHEAMLSGCIVIGYHGGGGREFMSPEYCFPIDFGDVLSFAKTTETVIKAYQQKPAELDLKRRRASEFVEREYSQENEKASIVDLWSQVGGYSTGVASPVQG